MNEQPNGPAAEPDGKAAWGDAPGEVLPPSVVPAGTGMPPSATEPLGGAGAGGAGGGGAGGGPPTSAPPLGWSAPESPRGGRSRRRWVLGAVVLAAIIALGYIFLVFLGGQVAKILGGTIEFGTGGAACSVTGPATSFPAATSFHVVAHAKRDVVAGETVTIAMTSPGGQTDTRDEAPATSTANCFYLDFPGGLPAGHYVMEFRVGTEVLAHGEFDIKP